MVTAAVAPPGAACRSCGRALAPGLFCAYCGVFVLDPQSTTVMASRISRLGAALVNSVIAGGGLSSADELGCIENLQSQGSYGRRVPAEA